MLFRSIMLPVVVMTGHGDVDTAVSAMKAGAVDFIEKPFEKASLMACVDAACQQSASQRGASARRDEAEARLNVLTERESEVLRGLVQGLPNKTIAYDLGISPRTVEIHRMKMMGKLGARHAAEAVRLRIEAESADVAA